MNGVNSESLPRRRHGDNFFILHLRLFPCTFVQYSFFYSILFYSLLFFIDVGAWTEPKFDDWCCSVHLARSFATLAMRGTDTSLYRSGRRRGGMVCVCVCVCVCFWQMCL